MTSGGGHIAKPGGGGTARDIPRREAGSLERRVLLAASLLLGAPASAQQPTDPVGAAPEASLVVHGWVVDATTRQPLAGAYVMDEGSGVRTTVLEDGTFALTVPPADAYDLRAGRFGYWDMRFRAERGMVGEPLLLRLRPRPVAVEGIEVTVDRLERLEERLERRTRGYAGGAVRTLYAEDLSTEADAGRTALDVVVHRSNGMLFECRETPGEICARPRPRPTLDDPGRPREAPITVCVDERRTWGGVAELGSIPAEEIQRVEFFGFGGRDHVRIYSRRFMIVYSRGEGRGLLPVDPMTGPPC